MINFNVLNILKIKVMYIKYNIKIPHNFGI